MNDTVREKPTFGTAAVDLRAIADLFEKVGHVQIDSSPWVHLDIQVDGTDAQIIERTDAVGQALFGKPGGFKLMSSGSWFYEVEGHVGMVKVHLFDSVAEATYREHRAAAEIAAKEAELARLRAEVEQLRAERGAAAEADESDEAIEAADEAEARRTGGTFTQHYLGPRDAASESR